MKINIEGMHCSSCEETLQAAIESVKGVDSVKVDHVSGTAQIDGSPVSQDIIDAVNGSGYEVSASPQAEPPISIYHIKRKNQYFYAVNAAYNNTCVHFSWCVSS